MPSIDFYRVQVICHDDTTKAKIKVLVDCWMVLPGPLIVRFFPCTNPTKSLNVASFSSRFELQDVVLLASV